MQILRTPAERFAGIPGYPFAENWIEIDLGNGMSARQHYLDEGPKDAPPVLLFHGEPSWSYLYRKIIPLLVDAGFRVLAKKASKKATRYSAQLRATTAALTA